MARVVVPFVIFVIAALIILPQTFFTVDETQLAIVTRFGEFKRAHVTPGLRVKTPFVESVRRFDKRLLRVDASAASLLTSDKRNLVIDAYARYRIGDPLLFFRRLTSEFEAGSRVSAIVNSQLRSEVALDLQSDVISETREEIMQRVTTASNRSEISRAEALALEDGGLRSPLLTIIVNLAVQDPEQPVRGRTATEAEREALLGSPNPPELTGLRASYFIPLLTALGIEIVDVRIKRADFPPDIEESVFARMRAERERIASGLRAEGDQRDAEIRADVDRQVRVITETALGESAVLRGEGERDAILILAEALGQDPEFYDFQRSLEAYRNSLGANTTVLLDADSDFLKFLQDPSGNIAPPAEQSEGEPGG